MKAAVLHTFGAALAVETLADPVLGTGEVIVDVIAAGVAGYAGGVFSGARNYLLELPIAPGAGGNTQALDDLVRRFGARVRPAPMTGVEADDRRLIGELAGGPIDLAQFDLTEFTLDDVNDAVAHAAANAGPLRFTVLRPGCGGAGG